MQPKIAPLAILSDIHGNIDALAAVLEDATKHGCVDAVCLGDIVGYGPAPGACVRLVRERCATSVLGNHEDMVLTMSRQSLTLCDEGAELWDSLALCQKDLEAADKRWISQLPLTAANDDMTFVHASLHDPREFDYIDCEESARRNFAAQESFVSFHGHPHAPVIWEKAGRTVVGYIPEAAEPVLSPSRLYAVGVGSVGQPRDGDPRASYAIYEPHTRRLIIRRVEYDIAKARKRFSRRGMTGFNSRRIVEGF